MSQTATNPRTDFSGAAPDPADDPAPPDAPVQAPGPPHRPAPAETVLRLAEKAFRDPADVQRDLDAACRRFAELEPVVRDYRQRRLVMSGYVKTCRANWERQFKAASSQLPPELRGADTFNPDAFNPPARDLPAGTPQTEEFWQLHNTIARLENELVDAKKAHIGAR